MAPRNLQLASTVLALAFALTILDAEALWPAELDGDWQATFRGQAYSLEDESTEPVSTLSTLTISSEDRRVVVDIEEIEGVLATTRFTGDAGNVAFSAIGEGSGTMTEPTFLYGRLKGDQLEGRLFVPRAAAGAKSGWAELTFVAERSLSLREKLDQRRRRLEDKPETAPPATAKPGTPTTPPADRGKTVPGTLPGAASDPTKEPSRAPASSSGESISAPGKLILPKPSTSVSPRATAAEQPASFELELYDATEPSKPTVKQEVRFGLRALAPGGMDVQRVELYVNGAKAGSAVGDTLDLSLGPYPAGRLTYRLVAFSSSGARGESTERSLEVQPAGTAVVSGIISGKTALISAVELVDSSEIVVQRTRLDSSGRFEFRDLPAGWYWVFVDDGKREARIRVTRGSQDIECDGRSTYRVDFSVD